ncbi:phosphatase PAP2 family protein [Pelagibacterium lacus]|uniref:PAP2 family protein n=1 Tax=Pelagibacterium lacus TaxID=2282655 RepID=A0A369W1Q3_9HYPH|nr:phosphatase PAP2 family protein [Pelagibacterium lacus]RDE08293.1 PAP2 family protein [Pelagibacterium lacus]
MRTRRFLVSEYAVLVALGLASLLALVFFDIADNVMEGNTREADMAVLNLFRVPGDPSQIIGPVWLHEAVRDLTALGSGTVLTIIVTMAALCLLLLNQRRGAVLIVVATLSGTLLSNTLKLGYARERPDFETIYATLTNSFPSGHAMLSAVTFLTLGALLARFAGPLRLKIFLFAAAIVLTLAIGASRIFLGVHYPSDVMAGWALGAAWALMWSGVAAFLQRRRMLSGLGKGQD